MKARGFKFPKVIVQKQIMIFIPVSENVLLFNLHEIWVISGNYISKCSRVGSVNQSAAFSAYLYQ